MTGVIAPLLAARAQPVGIAIAFTIGVSLHLTAQSVLSLVVADPSVEKTDEFG